jgi:predicted ArsR family transcriptional regulator
MPVHYIIIEVVTSRQQVLEYVRAQRTVTAADLSRVLGMTPANARHHLKILQELELVVATTYRKQVGKGRPARIFRLSEKIGGNNSELLATLLLNELFERTSSEDLPVLLQTIAKRIAGSGDIQTGSVPINLAARLYLAIQRLNRLHYQARWEARSNAPRLVFSNCPYLNMVERIPVMCEIDLALIQVLVGMPASQKDRLVQDSRGERICIFQLGTTRTGTLVNG